MKHGAVIQHAGMDAPTTSQLTTVAAGDTWRYTRRLSDYPASIWTLAVKLVGPAATYSATVAPDDDDYIVTFSAAITADVDAGAYTLVEAVSLSDERYIVGRYTVTVTPDPLTAAVDLRGQFRKALDAARAHLAAYATSGTWRAVTINTAGRITTCATPEQLRAFISLLENEVAREEAEANGRPDPRRSSTVYCNFGRSV